MHLGFWKYRAAFRIGNAPFGDSGRVAPFGFRIQTVPGEPASLVSAPCVHGPVAAVYSVCSGPDASLSKPRLRRGGAQTWGDSSSAAAWGNLGRWTWGPRLTPHRHLGRVSPGAWHVVGT